MAVEFVWNFPPASLAMRNPLVAMAAMMAEEVVAVMVAPSVDPVAHDMEVPHEVVTEVVDTDASLLVAVHQAVPDMKNAVVVVVILAIVEVTQGK